MPNCIAEVLSITIQRIITQLYTETVEDTYAEMQSRDEHLPQLCEVTRLARPRTRHDTIVHRRHLLERLARR